MCKTKVIAGILIVIAFVGLPMGVQAQSDEGLVAEWHFDEGSGSVVEDSSGNGNDGIIYGASWVDGKFGKALSFDGVDDYVGVGSHDELINFNTEDFAVETWIKSAATSADLQAILAYVNAACNNPDRYVLQITHANKIRFCTGEAGHKAPCVYSDLAIVGDGQWHHIVGERKSGILYLYIDCIQQTDTADSSTVNLGNFADTKFSIGSHDSERYPRYFNGIIDEVCIYNRALTTEEIKEHYEQGPTALSITKTATPNSIRQGQTTTITLIVKNTGSTEITDIEIADTIPQDLTFVDGETSKTYASLSPMDSRQFQYVVRLNEAGTYNLCPATLTYADEKGNYHTVKSKPFAIEVIPSLVETTDQIQRTAGINAQTASVHLHGEKTDVVIGEDILLKLAAVNLITKPTMHVQVIITPPSGMSVTSSEFVQSGAGLFTASYEIEPGVGRDIEVRMRSNQVGDFVVNGRIVYYFGDDMEHAEDHTLTLPITVRPEAEPTDSSSESKESSTPGFAAVVAVIGILLAYRRK